MNRAITSARAIALPLAAASGRIDVLDGLRSLIVIGCAAALILARQSLPF